MRNLEELAIERYPTLRLMRRVYEDAHLARAPGARCEVELVESPR